MILVCPRPAVWHEIYRRCDQAWSESGSAMHSEGIANGFGADAKGRCDGLIAIATNLFFCWPEPFYQPATLIIHTARIARAVQRAVRSQFDATSFATNSGGCPSRSSRACSGI